MFIAASGIDETNLLSCMIASKMGAKRKIARVRNPGLYNGTSILTKRTWVLICLYTPRKRSRRRLQGC
jgi:hypothetical protein